MILLLSSENNWQTRKLIEDAISEAGAVCLSESWNFALNTSTNSTQGQLKLPLCEPKFRSQESRCRGLTSNADSCQTNTEMIAC
ncbi:MAG TPA: hypothetical protein VGR47_00415 [Terracidiphilus sp.]|nr:hypothetical protein [Terracidiphilus sp.]